MKHKLTLSLLFLVLFIPLQDAQSQSKSADYEKLIGSWLRPDGGYVLVITAVDDKGNLDAEYFNPNNINVAQAHASIEEKQIKIYVEMQDIGYPGSNYRLRYDKKNNRLVGVYHHAVLKQDFNIYFVREKTR